MTDVVTCELKCQKRNVVDGVQLSPYKLEKSPSPGDRMSSCSPVVGDQLINLSLHSPRHSPADLAADRVNSALLVGHSCVSSRVTAIIGYRARQ